ncbi:cellulose synthase [Ramlibacter sp.]|uniref:cellulose synthase n=1 Tax=Ramlibacter sp. TaxID=1917967 RepID=UPI00183A6455|nr:cellulose synthase [Ramlibacter sp.]MBA2676136.1 cellulose synthase [Ramlibacter sp.]
MHSILEILLVNTKTGTAKKSGQPYSISEAHCVLRDESGKAGAVGVLTVPKALEEVAKPGLYTASFTLEAPTYGENAGKIVAALSGLVPIPASALKRASAATAPA